MFDKQACDVVVHIACTVLPEQGWIADKTTTRIVDGGLNDQHQRCSLYTRACQNLRKPECDMLDGAWIGKTIALWLCSISHSIAQ
jgi:hypothetical protein